MSNYGIIYVREYYQLKPTMSYLSCPKVPSPKGDMPYLSVNFVTLKTKKNTELLALRGTIL